MSVVKAMTNDLQVEKQSESDVLYEFIANPPGLANTLKAIFNNRNVTYAKGAF